MYGNRGGTLQRGVAHTREQLLPSGAAKPLGSMGSQFRFPLKPLEHHGSVVPRSSTAIGALIYVAMRAPLGQRMGNVAA